MVLLKQNQSKGLERVALAENVPYLTVPEGRRSITARIPARIVAKETAEGGTRNGSISNAGTAGQSSHRMSLIID
jgi:hypothetical protein